MYSWIQNVYGNAGKLVIIESGAGNMVATVRFQSERIAEQTNGTLIRINPRDYDVPHGHIGIPLGAKEGIERILESV